MDCGKVGEGQLTPHYSCQGKSVTLGIPVGREEIAYFYPVGDPEPGSGKSHLTKLSQQPARNALACEAGGVSS